MKGDTVNFGDVLCTLYIGDNENYIASDVPAILKYTNKYIVLNDGEFAKKLVISLNEDIEEASGYMGYRISVGDSVITVEGYDNKGIAQGLYFLEVNTIPGMTSASLVPQMVRAAGLSMTDFLTTIIENS